MGCYKDCDDCDPFEYAKSSTAEQLNLMRDRANSLWVVQQIAESYGGRVEVDLANNELNVIVPEDKEVECMERIDAAMAEFYWGEC